MELATVVGVAALCFFIAGGVFGFALGEMKAKRWYQRQLMLDMENVEVFINENYDPKPLSSRPWVPLLLKGGKRKPEYEDGNVE